ncbi:hypothetical protein Barb7_01953 [Bacteroidales bacterium Barb7]|nr:hypothetical protein Barb7_01953 [Bacteroidales bacterium Barb7]
MFDLLRDVLKSDAGTFGFVFSFVVLSVYAVYKITKFKTVIEIEHGALEKRVDRMESNIEIRDAYFKHNKIDTKRVDSNDP